MLWVQTGQEEIWKYQRLKVVRVHSENVQSRYVCRLLGAHCENAEEIPDKTITLLLIDIKKAYNIRRGFLFYPDVHHRNNTFNFKIKHITSFVPSAEYVWRKYWLKTYTWIVT
jgi:phage pi2 protein 07